MTTENAQSGMSVHAQVLQVCHMLANAGLDFVVAGGFARDIAAGLEPKDADIMVYNSSYWLPRSVWVWAESNGLATRVIPSYGEGGGDFDVRVRGVVKVGAVDIIFYRDVQHWSHIIGEFDFNINQFYFPSSVPRFACSGEHGRGERILGYYQPAFGAYNVMYAGTSELDTLTPVRMDYSERRREYMMHKYYDTGLRAGLLNWVEKTRPLSRC